LKRNAYPIMPLAHPTEVCQDYDEDRYMFKHIFNSAYISLFKEWLNELMPKQQE